MRRDVHAALHRRRHHRARQSVGAVVGDAHRFVVVVERNHDQHGPEHLLLCDRGGVVDADDHGGRHVVAAGQVIGQVLGRSAAGGDFGATAACLLDSAEYPVLLHGADHRSDKGFRAHRIADRHGLVGGGDVCDCLVEQRPVDQQAGGRRARLPGMHTDPYRRGNDPGRVGVVEHD